MPGTAFSAANWGGYVEAQVQAAYRPAEQVDGFSFLVDLSEVHADASEFGTNVQSDGADIRVTLDDGTTELAYDLIDWNYGSGSPTGLLRFNANSVTAGTTVRIYVDYTPGTATAYDANETYGSDNAYDANWIGYWPLASDANDRTVYVNHLTANGGLTFGSGTGRIGRATVFDGVDDFLIKSFGVNEPPEFMGATAFTVVADALSTSLVSWNTVFCFAADVSDPGVYLRQRAISEDISVTQNATSSAEARGGSISTTMKHFVGTSDFTSGPEVFQDNVSVGTGAATSGDYTAFGAKNIEIGANDGRRFWTGSIANVHFHDIVRTSNWRSHEYDQTNDNATFWGTWNWTSSGGGNDPITGSIFASATLSGDISATGTIAGSTNGIATLSGSLTAQGDLAGSVDAAGSLAGDLSAIGALSGSIDAAGSLTGDLSGGTGISGAISASATLTGSLTAQGELSGSVSATGSLAGDLSNATPANDAITGTINASATLSGTMTAKRLLTGSIDASGTLSGDISDTGELAGSVSSQGSLSGTLTSRQPITGNISATSSLSGELSASTDFRGEIAATVTLSGTLTAKGLLAGSVNAAVTTAAEISATGALSGSVDGQGELTATLRTKQLASGSILATVTLTGRIKDQGAITGTISATSTISGSLANIAATKVLMLRTSGQILVLGV